MTDTLWFFDVSLQCRKEKGLIICAKSKIGNKGNHAGKQESTIENRKNTGKKHVKRPGKTVENISKAGKRNTERTTLIITGI